VSVNDWLVTSLFVKKVSTSVLFETVSSTVISPPIYTFVQSICFSVNKYLQHSTSQNAFSLAATVLRVGILETAAHSFVKHMDDTSYQDYRNLSQHQQVLCGEEFVVASANFYNRKAGRYFQFFIPFLLRLPVCLQG